MSDELYPRYEMPSLLPHVPNVTTASGPSELAAPAGSARTFFFGVKSADSKGHYLFAKNLQAVWGEREQRVLPFRYTILDGGLLPPGLPEEQGRLHLAVINGWTVLGMWDRTADTRGACNASFIAEGVHTIENMKAIAARDFPTIWSRVQNVQADLPATVDSASRKDVIAG